MKVLEREIIDNLAEEFCQKYGFDHADIKVVFNKDIEHYTISVATGEVFLDVEHIDIDPEEAEEAEIKVEVFENADDTLGNCARMTTKKITEGNIWHCLLLAIEDMFE